MDWTEPHLRDVSPPNGKREWFAHVEWGTEHGRGYGNTAEEAILDAYRSCLLGYGMLLRERVEAFRAQRGNAGKPPAPRTRARR